MTPFALFSFSLVQRERDKSMTTESENSVQIFYMDEDDNIVEKHLATQVRILEYKDGERFETYGLVGPDEGEEDTK